MTGKIKAGLAAIVVLMGALLALRWNMERKFQPEARVAPVGVQPPMADEAPPPQVASEQPAAGNEPAPVMDFRRPQIETVRTVQQQQYSPAPPEVTGPTTMSKAKCAAAYKDYPYYIAAYSKALGGQSALDYSVCHAILTSEGDCVFSNYPSCAVNALYYRMIYSAASGHYDIGLCREFMMRNAINFSDAPQFDKEAACRNLGEVFSGGAEPKGIFTRTGLGLSGTGACSGLDEHKRKSCVLLADMVNGVKTGSGRFWLYDVLSGKGCGKADADLVDRYCSNKIDKRSSGN